MKLFLFAFVGLGLCLAAPVLAAPEYAQGALDDGEPRVEARLLVHPDRSDATTLRAGVLITPDPGWHLYWKNPGDTGLPTQLAWRGGEAGPLRWPAPSAFDEDGLVTYGYEGTVLLSSEIRPAAGAETLAVDVDVLVCRHSCIPAKLSLERPLSAVYAGEASDAVRRLFALHDEALPREPGALGFRVEAALGGAEGDGRVTLAVEGCPGQAPEAPCAKFAALRGGPAFFPAEAGLRVLEIRAASGGLTLLLEREADASPRVAGVLALLGGDGRIHHLEVELTAAAPGVAAGHVLGMLALAVLGGLMLNLMPCVLPVLALKAFAVAELAGSGRREALAHGAAYTRGILASMLALAAVVLALRLAGNEVGWGFQFQSPGFLRVRLGALRRVRAQPVRRVRDRLRAEQPRRRRRRGRGRAPQLLRGPARRDARDAVLRAVPRDRGRLRVRELGAASIVAIFLAIGLGLALPFLRSAPSRGRRASCRARARGWSTCAACLGFALLATVVWLLWVVGRERGRRRGRRHARAAARRRAGRARVRQARSSGPRCAAWCSPRASRSSPPRRTAIHSESAAAAAAEQRAVWQPAELAAPAGRGPPGVRGTSPPTGASPAR